MSNPLMGGFNQMPQNGGNPFGNIFGLLTQFQNFKKNFQGDPRQRVQDLLNSGQMSQEQLEQCENMARQFQGFLH